MRALPAKTGPFGATRVIHKPGPLSAKRHYVEVAEMKRDSVRGSEALSSSSSAAASATTEGPKRKSIVVTRHDDDDDDNADDLVCVQS